MPKFKNREEYEKWKAKRLDESKEKAHKIKFAEEIVRSKPASEIRELFEEKAPPKLFIEQLPGVFLYPFKGHGIYALIGGTLFLWVLDFLLMVPFVGFILAVFVGGYLSAYVMKIIRSSSDGEEEVPDWPDFTDFWDDILRPFFLLISVVIVSMTPAVIFFIAFKDYVFSIPISLALVFLGSLLMPMALIAVSMFESVRALNPVFIISSIIKVPLDYLIAVVFLLLAVALEAVVKNILVLAIPFVGAIIGSFLSLYFLIIEARILGLIYNSNRIKLNWFREEQ